VGAKDGSIPTHPIIPVDNTKKEAQILRECLSWLKRRNVYCKRHDAGTFQNQFGQWGAYGIKGSGDIHGMLRKHGGKHYEIECKHGSGGHQNAGQRKRMREVRENNGLYFIVHGVEELEHYMGEWV